MRTTIADIAKEAGVSKATVSRVLNGKAEGVGKETRLRVKALIEQMDFEYPLMAAFRKCRTAAEVCNAGKQLSSGTGVPPVFGRKQRAGRPFHYPHLAGIDAIRRERLVMGVDVGSGKAQLTAHAIPFFHGSKN